MNFGHAFEEEDTTVYQARISVITPDSFNEFVSEIADGVNITEGGMLEVIAVSDGMALQHKVYAPGQWVSVHTVMEEIA